MLTVVPRFARVGVVCNRLTAANGGIDQAAHEWGVRAVAECGPHLPLLIPALPAALDVGAVLDVVDGLLFPGGVSNIGPAFYGAMPGDPAMATDAARDQISLPLLTAAIAAGKPVFCICRGLQELNVALGGTLFQAVHRVPERLDHRGPNGPAEKQFSPIHTVTVVEGGMLAGLLAERRFAVNSLHGQGIETLAPILRAEAVAPDGQIEAVSLPSAKGFVLGVQWHPEWRWSENPQSKALFGAFAAALAQIRTSPCTGA